MTDPTALRAAAEGGDVEAMVELALLLEEDLTGEDDQDELQDEVGGWLSRAAAAGHVRGVAEFGSFLWHVWKDEDAALPWLQRAADAGQADAMAVLGDVYDFLGDIALAKRWYQAAADLGDPHAQDNLAALDRLTS
ncbi:sel1 repeat family protein [Actinosynnema sp. NPDC047251]|uniref:Sel1 repeat family protein n=1 Tax=Saccharothrix espanaensis (strain ATCC 51144 / DSM 44229 / JCM 9112 / NBRC 15066 / NRRL 15764) TaxID=1179773 RepID=K0JP01_SACES|nr:sel1 repeat family protein [Saccharothrix espanaensis]CCH28075.1 hypothetical protein BN6_07460 [Saccharothrix espanaensis DSM 44229]